MENDSGLHSMVILNAAAVFDLSSLVKQINIAFAFWYAFSSSALMNPGDTQTSDLSEACFLGFTFSFLHKMK